MLKEQSSIIKVIGIGGGGGNAVNHMYNQGISGVDFIVCNTDAQALELSPIPNKVQLGASLTKQVWAAVPVRVQVRLLAKASPKELGILTVAIITTPFTFEGKKRRAQAEEGLEELLMNDSGVAIMGNAKAKGDNRALEAVTGALASPLLKDNEIEGARYILLNITSGTMEVTMDEVAIITDFIQDKAGLSAMSGSGSTGSNNTLEDELSVTISCPTGFQTSEQRVKEKQNEKIALPLTPENNANPFVKPVSQNQFVPREAAPSARQPCFNNRKIRLQIQYANLRPDLFSPKTNGNTNKCLYADN
ncbi:hypothetical protein FQR65_LT15173 [Abscondita terminalis]|nr:hypothetical protein FQR65_LT15173 [Abscondita terminalis]